MSTVVEISDTEDADDCVIKSVVFVVDDEPASDLYHEAKKENKLLGDFIEKCLSLENSVLMKKVLKENLLQYYYEADKTARESPKFQKNLRRANYLLQTEPQYKFTHIKDLCNILKASKVKKRVPFITITINLSDVNCKPKELKRHNSEQLGVINGMNKTAKLDINNTSPFTGMVSNSFNSTCDTLDESLSMETCSQQSSAAEEDKLIIPKKGAPNVCACTEKRIRVIESKIASYKKTIAFLDELEVDDDSINSPYIKSERLKSKIVSLYKERCQLMGSQPVKRKRIRLKLADGHPPGPTRALERFLNMNLNKDGDPPFPDFCDVVNCVTETNVKDDLGWTKAQIMNEASALFMLCGRALQKRRQNREYQDLLYKVKLEDVEKDPADDDPELKAKLEENKRIAIKKESDMLERYTMLQYLPSKLQKIETTENENIGEANVISGSQQKLIKKNNNNKENLEFKSITNENSYDSAVPSLNNKNMIIVPKCNASIEIHECGDTLKSNNNESLNDCKLKMKVDNEKSIPAATIQHDVDTNIGVVKHCSDINIDNKTNHNKIISTGAGRIAKSLKKVKNKVSVHTSIINKDNELENKSNVIKNQILPVKSLESRVRHEIGEVTMGTFKSNELEKSKSNIIQNAILPVNSLESQVKHELGEGTMVTFKSNELEKSKSNIIQNAILPVKHKQDEDVMGMFTKLGKNFTLTVEIMNDS